MLTCSRYACISAGEKLRKNQEAKAVEKIEGENPETSKIIDAPQAKISVSDKTMQNEKPGFLSRWVKKIAGL